MIVPDRKRVALVGIGGIARKVYLPLLANHPDVEVAGVLSRSATTVQDTVEAYRFPKGTTDLNELLSWGVDAVFVHSPTPTHYDIVMKCLERRVAVYVDKPLSYDLKESQEMARFAEKQGVLLAVGFNRRYAPLYMQAKAWLEQAGGISQCTAVKHRTQPQSSSSRETVYDDLIHMLDLLLWLCGNDYELLRSVLQSNEEGQLLQSSGLLGWNSGTSGMFSMIRDAGTDLEKLELHGNGRSAEVVNLETAVLYEKGGLPRSQGFGSWDTILQRRGFSGAVDDFLNHIDSPEQCDIAAAVVLASHKLAEELTD
ncbi:dehydrogenase [Bacillus sp. FJAT-27264]|uniref:Gfo/Idh/MocA family protein n=1 Tax=Paenibacillus sp. (strain DSM 101736 / FJAT-27264) TaxID=1850362 RepID=UPI000807D7F0|nr:Gfo/Idh/MocA family oxidoreductase [Bacillus sp. FJAT-27264]OBZ18990.1 dehydrogenase [Bacillus sp. FJAT-27264]